MPRCFIAMPVSTSSEHARLYGDEAHFHHVLVHLMVPAVEKAGYEAITLVAEGADLIHAEIIRNLETADMVLCDISTLNPNVFFEFGVRTAVDKPVCVVMDTLTDRIPFDTSIINVHSYDPSLAPWLLEDQLNLLASHLQASAQRSDGRNKLWSYFGLTTKGAFKEGESSLEEKVDLLLLQVQGLESRVSTIGTRGIIPNRKDFITEAQQIVYTARFDRADFQDDSVLLTYDSKVSAAERVELARLGSRYGVRVYVGTIENHGEVPDE